MIQVVAAMVAVVIIGGLATYFSYQHNLQYNGRIPRSWYIREAIFWGIILLVILFLVLNGPNIQVVY